eukprot:2080135-Alexandrium_andersonii.AAC.1
MSASLVGSEMCIRDSTTPVLSAFRFPPVGGAILLLEVSSSLSGFRGPRDSGRRPMGLPSPLFREC